MAIEFGVLPKCQFCKTRDAHWDAPTLLGPWAYMCDEDLQHYGYVESRMKTELVLAPTEQTTEEEP
jgi:hypothetical protein